MASVRVNGETVEIQDGERLVDLLKRLGEPYTLGLVELNHRLVRRSELERVTIVDGDAIEVVLPAFGG